MSNLVKSEEEKHKYCDTTLQMEQGVRQLFLLMGERLMRIRDERLYEAGWDTWNDFCLEFKDMSPASISKLISVYEVFVVTYGFTPDQLAKAGGWTKLYQILKFVHSKEEAEKWLALAETTSRQDLGKYLVEADTGVAMHECKHERTFLVRVCEDCGSKHRDYDAEAKLSTIKE